MTPDQLARLAAELDDVEIVHNAKKFPVPGTRAEKRAERSVALWFVIAAMAGLAFLGFYLFWPFEYRGPGPSPATWPTRSTPRSSAAPSGWPCWRWASGSSPTSRSSSPTRSRSSSATTAARTSWPARPCWPSWRKAGQDTGIARRSLITRSAGAAAGIFGLGLGIAAVAPLVRNPWKGGDKAALWTTGWAPTTPGEVVYLRRDTGVPGEVSLIRPEDQGAGSMETVFPFRRSERGNEEALGSGAAPLRQPRDADPAAPRHAGDPAPGSGDAATTATTTPTPRSARTWAARPRCTSRRRSASCARATSRSSSRPSTPSRFSVPRRAHYPNLPITVNDEGYLDRDRGLPRHDRPGLLGAWGTVMSAITTPTTSRRRARRPRPVWPWTSSTSATTRPPGCASSSTRSSRRTGRSCSARSRSTASSCCC